jgi:starch-binding outer membrane protein, SusD/RagB family
MNANNGLADLSADDVTFYNNSAVTNAENLHPEVIWYSAIQKTENSWEGTNYAPSLYGEGLSNPTQELVNAFPMLDGTPTPGSKINSSDPYSDRDPRLGEYILYNGAQFVSSGENITINTTAGSVDALGSANILATKTGYYLKKFMNVTSVNLDPNVNSKGLRYYTWARYTDALLMFAEAANEAVGPGGVIGGYSAREVINAIRTRAGITSTDYVDGLGQTEMTELIRNERRIEMCFEKQRFWDLRRWNMTTEMNKPVYGVEVSADGSTYSYLQVEDRNYAEYQIYGPIPYNETLKYEIVQNQGW